MGVNVLGWLVYTTSLPSLRAEAKQSSHQTCKSISILNFWIATKIFKVLSKTIEPKSKFSRNDALILIDVLYPKNNEDDQKVILFVKLLKQE